MYRINSKLITILFIALLSVLNTNAQSGQNIFVDLAANKPGQGTVKIKQDPKIKGLVGKKGQGFQTDASGQHLKLEGYRIQLYMDKQQKAKNEAKSLEQRVKQIYPELSTYVIYDSPNWRLRVGDFKSYEEADKFMRELRTDHKQLSREAIIVKDNIRLPL